MAAAGRIVRPRVRLNEAPADAAPGPAEVIAVRLLPGKEGVALGPDAAALARSLDVDLAAFVRREKPSAEPGQVVTVPLAGDAPRLVLLVGVGDGSARALRAAGAAAARRARDARSLSTSLAVAADANGLRAFVESMLLATYTFSRKSKPAKPALAEIRVNHPEALTVAVDHAVATASAVRRARDLTNTPSAEKSPAWLADAAAGLAEAAQLKVRIRDERALAAEGFGGILAVGSGSVRPPRLAELGYAPRGAQTHVVLVGKGITFDSGGLSIKPADGMVGMKTDMAGGAAVIAAMAALRPLGIRARVTGLIPIAENMPSGSAQRPGDVIRHYGGRTVEVLNTDAEGRLVLADALAYAVDRLRPDVLLDMATLTGAASLGLGRLHGALYATDDALADALLAAADAGGERLWRMPLVEDYRDALDSDIADLQNISNPAKRYSGGSIAAALFLREFTAGRRWAHIDMAGPARSDKDAGETSKGATGYGVRLLLRWLETLD